MNDKTPPVIKDELAADIDEQAHKQNADRVRRHLGEAEQALTDEFHTLLADAEQLLKHTASMAGEQADELRAKLSSSLERSRDVLKTKQDDLYRQGVAAKETTEEYVADNPFKALGIAAGVGFLIGLLASRR
ncbi:DUF883 family protein [Pseudomonas oryzihabitans]|uniref:DUF883 family protein n=1 Tax=Pseudomonas oryzihabitans TaxID=47885 RepID=UPI0011A0B271|nr:DUF883 family protein [Pseudomonas oryzihabitans]